MNLLIRLFILTVLWIVGGQIVTHMFYPELFDNETTKNAIPWLLLIGYAVGTFSSGVADAAGECLKRER